MGRAIVMVLALALSALPAGAGATTEDRALALHARAAHLDGWAQAPNGGKFFYLDEGGTAEVRMPPQTGAAVDRRPGGTTSVANTIFVRQDRKEDIADGNLAAGTASASSSSDAVTVTVPGAATIAARIVRSIARATCDGPSTVATASEGSEIAGLTINGQAVPVGEPNQVSRTTVVGDTRVTVEALRVVPTADGTGWSTVGLIVQVEAGGTNTELWLGTTSASLTCAG
jgi:hypothetical protein